MNSRPVKIVSRVGPPAAAAARPRAAVLLEVVLAMTLFTAAAATVLGALTACSRSAGRLRTEAVGENLAVTLLSEIQMGLVPAQDDGPYEYEEPYEGWTWELVTSEFQGVIAGQEMTRAEIIIANASQAYLRRLTVLMPSAGEDTESEDQGAAGTGRRSELGP